MAEKKKFFQVDLPLVDQKAELLAYHEENLAGRTIKLDLTRKLRGKSLEITFALKSENEKIIAVPKRLLLLGYFIRRAVRKGIDYVEDSFKANCKDAELIIKPFLIARKKVSRAIRNALRVKAKEAILETIKNLSYEELFSEILQGKFQRNLLVVLKKVYPLALCEIRDIVVLKSQEKVKVEKVTEAKEEK
ncbi:MAG: hypothetical protein NT076_04425 [Candidatus Pacearchaeota archaeon]|nr:hypothetical protein [Candidatus Pacearchaeota archaeon]